MRGGGGVVLRSRPAVHARGRGLRRPVRPGAPRPAHAASEPPMAVHESGGLARDERDDAVGPVHPSPQRGAADDHAAIPARMRAGGAAGHGEEGADVRRGDDPARETGRRPAAGGRDAVRGFPARRQDLTRRAPIGRRLTRGASAEGTRRSTAVRAEHPRGMGPAAHRPRRRDHRRFDHRQTVVGEEPRRHFRDHTRGVPRRGILRGETREHRGETQVDRQASQGRDRRKGRRRRRRRRRGVPDPRAEWSRCNARDDGAPTNGHGRRRGRVAQRRHRPQRHPARRTRGASRLGAPRVGASG